MTLSTFVSLYQPLSVFVSLEVYRMEVIEFLVSYSMFPKERVACTVFFPITAHDG